MSVCRAFRLVHSTINATSLKSKKVSSLRCPHSLTDRAAQFSTNVHGDTFLRPWKVVGPFRQLSSTTSAAMASSGDHGPRIATVAVAQMTSVGNQEANFATCRKLAIQAKEAGCCMLFLPECCSFIGLNQQEVCHLNSFHHPSQSFRKAYCDGQISLGTIITICMPVLQTVTAGQSLDGPAMTKFQGLARETGVWLSLGGFQETGPDPEHIYNTHVVLNGQGQMVSSYRKVSSSAQYWTQSILFITCCCDIQISCTPAEILVGAACISHGSRATSNAAYCRCTFSMLKSTTGLSSWRLEAQPREDR